MKTKIKQLVRFIKKYLGETILVIGVGLFIRNIFNFSYRIKDGLCFDLGCDNITGVAYYYSSDVLMGISIGAMLIVSGILIIKNNKRD